MAPETYLAYGPLHFNNGLVNPPAINADEENQLTLIYPKSEQAVLWQSLQLIQWFGTLGGRSRNGWGSINLQGSDIKSELELSTLQSFSRPLAECLQLEWPHAIGSDEQGLLIWKTPERDSWRLVMKDLAQTKIKFRTDLAFPLALPNGFQQRHLLAYPVTHHRVNAWVGNDRLANQLRFKIARTEKGFVGIIVHLPCAMPNQMSNKLGNNAPSIEQQIKIWQSVHKSLISLNDQGLEIKRINP
jgi:CRISPR-associated protein Cmr1